MLNFGEHAVYVWSSYAIALLVLSGLIIWLFAVGKIYSARLNDFQTRALKRKLNNKDKTS
ncbi:MAG: heme exporter protein CcmD [Hyphomicrobiaceae bacterium]|nr:heme exporter protein CcmD [Hyphomicrobiaceae bacterium]